MDAPVEIDEAAPGFTELLHIALDAAKIKPPLYVSTVLGLPRTWMPPFNRYSEFRVMDIWKLRDSLLYLFNISFPALPFAPPSFSPPFLNHLFWQPSVILQRPDHNGSYTSFPDEAWFFLNGIMTNSWVAQINAAYLAALFHRPVTLIQNSTTSALVDLLHCALGKEWKHITEEVVKAFPPIYEALKAPEKKKVVVIAHSQGTIIIARVLALLSGIVMPPGITQAVGPGERELEGPYYGPEFVYPSDAPLELSEFDPLTEGELAKLEVYCFATCANSLKYHRPPGSEGRPVPWIESYGNEFDIVARLGMLSPGRGQGGIDIDGPLYVRPAAWGHLLNQHYLFGIADYQRQGRRRGAKGGCAPFELANPAELEAQGFPADLTPRLFHYINGGR